MSKALKIIFAGTPDFAASALQACIASRHHVVAVFTQPDRPAGRGRKINYGPVKQLAVDASIPVFQPQRLNQEQLAQIESLRADVMLVSAYGLLLPKTILNIPKLGCINIHASLLPRWRGAAPIQRSIIAGDQKTGISIMQMEEGLDTGPVLQQFECEIQATDTGSSLHDRLAKIASAEIVQVLENLQDGKLITQPQDESQVSHAKKITKQEACIDWHLSAVEIARKIRAFNSWPVAYTYFAQQRLRIWQAEVSNTKIDKLPGSVLSRDKQSIEVATGKGVIKLIAIQLSGGKIISAQDFINAHDVSELCFTAKPVGNQLRASA
ncbi:MAG: methionyl-tRNA formyltransferase [Gammaproteobacteria bacterium]|nr:methionyl-tRNA formyltransferase [Gammaproteobacteria bacterium]